MEFNGVTFKDFALASANMAAGMSEEKIASVFGLEVPVWQDTLSHWNGKMPEMSHDDMKFFGEVFLNPKQGKFADVEGSAEGPEKVLAKYPEWSDFVKMEQHYAIADDVGVDIDLEKEYNVNMTEYSQLAMHWGDQIRSAMEEKDSNPEKLRSLLIEQDELVEKWETYFKEMYKDQSSNLSDDIDF